jgi:hypothetical protein
VSAIHDAIHSFLSGDLDGSLGEAVSGLLGSEADADTGGNTPAMGGDD